MGDDLPASAAYALRGWTVSRRGRAGQGFGAGAGECGEGSEAQAPLYRKWLTVFFCTIQSDVSPEDIAVRQGGGGGGA